MGNYMYSVNNTKQVCFRNQHIYLAICNRNLFNTAHLSVITSCTHNHDLDNSSYLLKGTCHYTEVILISIAQTLQYTYCFYP